MLDRPRIFFDFDKTLYDGHSYYDFVPHNFAHGVVPAATLRHSLVLAAEYKNGLVGYETALKRLLGLYAEGLRGQRYSELARLADAFYGTSDKFFPFVEPLFRELEQTHEIVLVSGEPQFMAAAVAKRLGVSAYLSSVFEVADDVFTGTVQTYLADRADKQAIIQAHYTPAQLAGSLAVGDSEGDIGMLSIAETAICINPTPGLKTFADKHRWYVTTDKSIQQLIATLIG